MTDLLTTKSKPASADKRRVGRLFFLDIGAGRILSMNPDGTDLKPILVEGYGPHPDGIVVDTERGHIYWTNMGDPSANDGSIERCDLDGKNLTVIVPPGGTYTPKQLKLDRSNDKLYWCDREGMRVMRANLDGSNIEVLVDASEGDPRPGTDERKWCVGIAADVDQGKIYWTQKGAEDGQGRIFRANLEIPRGQSAADRNDIEVLFDGLPEPIDLELDPRNRMIYWTDRGDPPRGNSVNRAPMDSTSRRRKDPEILFTHLMEGIGLALDLEGDRMFVADLAGTVYTARLDGSKTTVLVWAQGNLTGVAYAELPAS